jgi:hypothetical protein
MLRVGLGEPCHDGDTNISKRYTESQQHRDTAGAAKKPFSAFWGEGGVRMFEHRYAGKTNGRAGNPVGRITARSHGIFSVPKKQRKSKAYSLFLASSPYLDWDPIPVLLTLFRADNGFDVADDFGCRNTCRLRGQARRHQRLSIHKA